MSKARTQEKLPENSQNSLCRVCDMFKYHDRYLSNLINGFPDKGFHEYQQKLEVNWPTKDGSGLSVVVLTLELIFKQFLSLWNFEGICLSGLSLEAVSQDAH